MAVYNGRLFFSAAIIYISTAQVGCIVSKASNVSLEKADNAVAQSIDRDYVTGFEEGHGHGAYGLSAHANYGFPEGYEGYGGHEGAKYHVHHSEDHHGHHHHHDHHKHYDIGYHKALAIKSLLVPLAGVALLGAAAAFVSNPILLQLGVISGATLGRKRRDTNQLKPSLSKKDEERLKEIKFLERYLSQIPEQNIETQEKKLLANYLSCSGTTMKSLCLERLACELHSSEGTSMPMEANVLTIIDNEILGNEFVPEDAKVRLLKAISRGKKNLGCAVYECDALDKKALHMLN